MSETRYVIERAKSGRAKCKKCKQPIASQELRIGSKSQSSEQDFEMTHWNHVTCFRLPKKYLQGANKISVEDFVRDILEDESGENILSSTSAQQEVIDKIGSSSASTAAAAGKRKDSSKDNEDDDAMVDPIADLKAEYEQYKQSGANDEPPSKKLKQMMDHPSEKLDAYLRYKDAKNHELQDILKYNRQVMKGTKDFLLAKVIDGHLYGRLSRCHLCGGTLKMKLNSAREIECGGSFDETTQRRIPCSFTCLAPDAPRWQPWYEIEPTEEEAEAMDKLIEQFKEAGGVPDDAGGDDTNNKVQKLTKLAGSKIPWDLTNKAGIQKSVAALVELLREQQVDLPADAKQAKQKLGEIVLAHRDKTLSELIPILIQEFGFAQVKAAKAAQKKASLEGMVSCLANAGIVAVLQELSELYFKEGNRNAGASYAKAVSAVRDLAFAITADNALGLAKGKTKVPHIGKGTAEKIHEFITTGTIAKLDEKRADAA